MFAQRQVHVRQSTALAACGEIEQVAQHALGAGGARARSRGNWLPRRRISTPRRCFDQPQVLVERTAQMREPRVVLGHEIEFTVGATQPHGSSRRCFMRRPRHADRRPRSELGMRLGDLDVDEAVRSAPPGRRN